MKRGKIDIELLEYIKKHKPNNDWPTLATLVNNNFGTSYNGDSLRKYFTRLNGGVMKKKKSTLKQDRKFEAEKGDKNQLARKYQEAQILLGRTEKERDAVKAIRHVSTFKIQPKKVSGKSQSVAVMLASDFHVEESITKGQTNGLNEYNLKVAEARATQFFSNGLRLIRMFQQDTKIDTLILALLGDFISGSIHEDTAENNSLGPVDALKFAERLVASGIQFLLDNSELKLVIPCHSGNHARSTKEQRIATENENSFEYYMYHVLADHFRDEPRIKFLISPAYHSYVEVYDEVIRFHHGHFVRSSGGIGGIFTPVYKAIGNWNDGKVATLDCFGHHHQSRDGGTFICNGSLIGYNPYAVAIKAKFERPAQTLFLIERKRGRTITVPIRFDV